MTFVSEITGHWLGLCRKPPAFHASQEGFVNFHEPVHEGPPDGGAGGPGTIRRGIGAALSGMRTLNQNGSSSGLRSFRACAGGKHHRPGGTPLHRQDPAN